VLHAFVAGSCLICELRYLHRDIILGKLVIYVNRRKIVSKKAVRFAKIGKSSIT